MPDLMTFMRDRENRYGGIGKKKTASARRRLNLDTGLQGQPVEAPTKAQSPILDRSAGQPGGPSTDGSQAIGSVGVSGTNIQSLMDSMLKSSQEFYSQQQDRQRQSLLQQLLTPAQGTFQPLQSLGTMGAGAGSGAIASVGAFDHSQVQRPAGGNGYMPDDMLVDVGGGFRLQPAAAASWQQMVQAAAADGVDITNLESAYRTFSHQQDLVNRLGRYSEGGLAADAGSSPHGWGIAVDVNGDDARAWLAANGGQYGWRQDPREDWHFQFGSTNG